MNVKIGCLACLLPLAAAASWFDDPSVTAKVRIGSAYTDIDPHFMSKAADDSLLMVNLQAEGDHAPTVLFRIADLLSASGDTDGLTIPVASGTNWKGGAISSDLKRMIVGNGLANAYRSIRTDVADWNDWKVGTNTYELVSSNGYKIDAMAFGTGSTYLYSDADGGGKIVRWTFSSSTLDAASGNQLVYSDEKDSGVSRVRNLSLYSVQAKDLVYYGEGKSGEALKVFVMDVSGATSADWTTSELSVTGITGLTDDVITNVKLSNQGGLPVLYVLTDKGRLGVARLSIDGKSVTETVKVFTQAETTALAGITSSANEYPKFRNFEVTKDGSAAFLLHRNKGDTVLTVVKTPNASKVFDIAATGSVTASQVGAATVYTFTGNGKLSVTGSGTIDLLMVGGGGGGGALYGVNGYAIGAGGGAGGLVYKSSYAIAAGEYDITVGAGGAIHANGGNTTFGTLFTAYGGGAGANSGNTCGATGGSGGGSCSSGNNISGGVAGYASADNFGHDGGFSQNNMGPGGGGGAGATPTLRGSGGEAWRIGYGGDGLAFDITGVSTYYAGGGAGYRRDHMGTVSGGLGGGGRGNGTTSTDWTTQANAAAAGKGTDGLGGGGGGGAVGGKGVLIVRFTPSRTQNASDFALTGGDEVKKVKHGCAHIFNTAGTHTLTVPQACVLDVLVVGGGGGGGHLYNVNGYAIGSGGGAGGVVYRKALAVRPGTYDIVVGAGGEIHRDGGESSAFGIVAYGGGCGADSGNTAGNTGGSGGGSCSSGNNISGGVAGYLSQNNLGHAGGFAINNMGPGGGGGAGATPTLRGSGGDAWRIGYGGDGLAFDITGTSTYYAGGGAGYRRDHMGTVSGGLGGGGRGNGTNSSDWTTQANAAAAGKGTDGLGGGGGGGAVGGCGTVIVRYALPANGSTIIIR